MHAMRRTGPTGAAWKVALPAALDACYWKIDHQKWKWKTAEIIVKFTIAKPGINLGLWGNEAGEEVNSSSLIKRVVPTGEKITEGVEYRVDGTHYDMIVIAHPEYNSLDS